MLIKSTSPARSPRRRLWKSTARFLAKVQPPIWESCFSSCRNFSRKIHKNRKTWSNLPRLLLMTHFRKICSRLCLDRQIRYIFLQTVGQICLGGGVSRETRKTATCFPRYQSLHQLQPNSVQPDPPHPHPHLSTNHFTHNPIPDRLQRPV